MEGAVEVSLAYIAFYQMKSLTKCFISLYSTNISLSPREDLMKFYHIMEDTIHLGNLGQKEG